LSDQLVTPGTYSAPTEYSPVAIRASTCLTVVRLVLPVLILFYD